MANPKKQTPWAVEIQPIGIDGWFAAEAYRDEEEAMMQAELMRKRVPEGTGVRVIKFEA